VDPVEVVRDAGGVVLLLRPVAAQVLEGLPAGQEGVGGAVLPVQLGEQVGVVDVGLPLRVEPVAQHLDRAVDGHVLGDHECAVHTRYDSARGLRSSRGATVPGVRWCSQWA
jgi:hypothetical protein